MERERSAAPPHETLRHGLASFTPRYNIEGSRQRQHSARRAAYRNLTRLSCASIEVVRYEACRLVCSDRIWLAT